jgi:hypothetical protein
MAEFTLEDARDWYEFLRRVEFGKSAPPVDRIKMVVTPLQHAYALITKSKSAGYDYDIEYDADTFGNNLDANLNTTFHEGMHAETWGVPDVSHHGPMWRKIADSRGCDVDPDGRLIPRAGGRFIELRERWKNERYYTGLSRSAVYGDVPEGGELQMTDAAMDVGAFVFAAILFCFFVLAVGPMLSSEEGGSHYASDGGYHRSYYDEDN